MCKRNHTHVEEEEEKEEKLGEMYTAGFINLFSEQFIKLISTVICALNYG